MSELKRHHINEVMDMHNLTRGKMGYSIVYYADDVDKEIAELEEQIEVLKNQACKMNCMTVKLYNEECDANIHHKYKRCLTMAKWCERKRIDAANYRIPRKKWDFYDKWHKRWLELAEKFKEVK